VEALFTIDEESGMTGAFNLQPDVLQGEILINMDSEDEGELYIGCAGGTNANMQFEYNEEVIPVGMIAYELVVGGLKGGHSGLDIHLGRGNSNKILFRYLKHAVNKHGLRLASVDGGNLRNAIPRDASAIITIPEENASEFEKCLKDFEGTVQSELSFTEPDMYIKLNKTALPGSLIDAKTQNNLIAAIYGCPNGVMRMSDAMEGLIETSTNLSTVKSNDGKIDVQCLMRSSVESAKEDLADMIESVFLLAGAKVWFDGTYPGWKPNPDSPILKEMLDVYKNRFGKVPEIKAIHAGLECGLFSSAYPKWDMISFGPTIRYPHSPDEKVNIETVDKFWIFLVETLKHIPVK